MWESPSTGGGGGEVLRVVSPWFAQITLSIETLLNMSTLSIEDVTGRLKAVEDCAEAPTRMTAGG